MSRLMELELINEFNYDGLFQFLETALSFAILR